MSSTVRTQIGWILSRWPLVLAITVLATVAAIAGARGEQTTYTGKSTLILSARSPEQDAVLVRGYVEMFNDSAYQSKIHGLAELPDSVTVSAHTAALSPILYVEATATDRELAAESALAAASAFRDDMNAVQRAGREDALVGLREELAAIGGGAQGGVVAPSTYQAQLQERILQLETDTTNALQDLQVRAGVTASAPDPVRNAILGFAGGLVLGCAAAVLLGMFSPRLRDTRDVRDKTGLEVLAVVPRGDRRSGPSRADAWRRLGNRVDMVDLPRPTVVAVTAARPTTGVAQTARALAEQFARQGRSSLLVRADLRRTTGSDAPPGTAELLDGLAVDETLDGRAPVSFASTLLPGTVSGMRMIVPGRGPADPNATAGLDRVTRFLRHTRTAADVVVVEAPTLSDTSESQLYCAAADAVIIVVTPRRSTTGEVTAAAETVREAGGTLLGVALVDRRASADGGEPSWEPPVGAGPIGPGAPTEQQVSERR